MGNRLSNTATVEPELGDELSDTDFYYDSLFTSSESQVVKNGSSSQRKTATSTTYDLCHTCWDVLTDTSEFSATRYHSTLSSLERSVCGGCHLCTLVRHFLPERPRHQLDEYMTLSLRWDGTWEGSLLAGWRHQTVSFNLLQLGGLTKYQREYYRELRDGQSTTMHIYKAFATSMLSHCIEKHPGCRSVQEPFWSPTRLIEIKQTRDGYKLRLITSPPKEPYIALSHCWGTAHLFKLLSNNLEEMKKDIEMSQLPKTFQDAISITTWFSVRYIWIDSCCIIQDSIEDWLEESAMMDKVYRNAYCTVAADGAADSNGGCIINQNTLAIRPCMVHTDDGPMYCLPPEALLQRNFELEPLEQRAWALQERILSPRILHCTTDQLFWECNEEFKCQTYPHDLKGNGDFRKVPRITLDLLPHGSLHSQWNGVILDYCKRSLTKEEDKLIALSGIAKAFQSRMTDDIYLAGLWYYSLPLALLWRVADETSVTRPSSYRAPSWSWASIDGNIIPNNTETAMDICQPCLDVLSSNIDLVSEDTTGQVKGGDLHVCGLMRPVRWCKLSQRLILVEDRHFNLDSQIQKDSFTPPGISFFPDAKEVTSELDGNDVYCLLIQSRFLTLDGIVICGTCDPLRFRRIGVFHAAGAEACTAIKYDQSSVPYNNEHLSRQLDDREPEMQVDSRDMETRTNALEIVYDPNKPTSRKFKNVALGVESKEVSMWDNTYDPYRRPHLFDSLWKSSSTNYRSPWDQAEVNSRNDISFTDQGTSPRMKNWIATSNFPSIPSASSRKSKTKAIYATYHAKITDPLSVYLLDPPYYRDRFQRLKTRSIILV